MSRVCFLSALLCFIYVLGGCNQEVEITGPSALESGSVNLDVGGWDDFGFSFGSGSITYGGGGDIAAYISTSGVAIRVPDGKIFDLGPVHFESVSTGVDRGRQYLVRVVEGHVYSIKVRGGFYAKILVTQAGTRGFSKGVLAFDWVFQRNHTPNFMVSVPTLTPIPETAPAANPAPLAAPLIAREPGDPSIYLYGIQTQDVELGQPLLLDLSVVNSIGKPPMTVQFILRVPSGWSLSGAGFVESCTGQCSATYKVRTGGNRSIQITLQPNQSGSFVIQGRMEWLFGDDQRTLGGQNLLLPVTVKP